MREVSVVLDESARMLLPNSHRPPDTTRPTRRSCLCRVRRCELSLPDRQTSAFASECVRRSHRQCLRRQRHSDAECTCRAGSGRLNSHRHTRHDKTVLSVPCLMCRCELYDCSKRVQTSNFLSATVLNCPESNSHRRSVRDTDKTVLSCLAWRCELAVMQSVISEHFTRRPGPQHTAKHL